MAIRYERIYPPSWTDRHDPRCPECGEAMFFAGTTSELKDMRLGATLNRDNIVNYKLFQCCTCRRLFKEVRE